MRAFAFLIALGVRIWPARLPLAVVMETTSASAALFQQGDAERFAAVAKNYPTGTFVSLNGPRGYIIEALDIGDIIQKRGFSLLRSGARLQQRTDRSHSSEQGSDWLHLDFLAADLMNVTFRSLGLILMLILASGRDGAAGRTAERHQIDDLSREFRQERIV